MTTVTDPWWADYADMLPADMLDMIAAEDTATRITTWEPHLIPGLLQTDGYARAVMTAAGADSALTDRGALLRATRQRVLRRTPPPRLVAYIDEAALRRAPDGQVMLGQLGWLGVLAEDPGITVRVLPLDGPPVPRVTNSFHLIDRPAGPVVYVEDAGSANLRTAATAVEAYRAAAARLDEACLPARESAGLILRLATAGG